MSNDEEVKVLQCSCGGQRFYIHQEGGIECVLCGTIKTDVLVTEGTIIEKDVNDVVH